MKKHTKKVIQTTVSLAVLVGSIYLALRGVDLHKFAASLQQVNYWWVLATIPFMGLSFFVRAMRWKTLLAPIRRDVSLINAFSATMVGYLINNLIPRGGEILRPVLFGRRENMSATTVLATVFVERVIDTIALLLLILFTFAVARNQITTAFPDMGGTIVGALVVPLVVIMILLILLMKTTVGEVFLRLIVRPFSERWYERLHNHLRSFVAGFAVLSAPGQYLRVTVETLIIQILVILPLYMAFFAFGFESQLHLTILDATLLCMTTTLAFVVAPSPGALGIYHTFAQITLVKFYGLSPEVALAYATVTHGAGYLLQIVLGGAFFLREQAKGFSWRSVSKDSAEVLSGQ